MTSPPTKGYGDSAVLQVLHIWHPDISRFVGYPEQGAYRNVVGRQGNSKRWSWRCVCCRVTTHRRHERHSAGHSNWNDLTKEQFELQHMSCQYAHVPYMYRHEPVIFLVGHPSIMSSTSPSEVLSLKISRILGK